MKVRNLLEDISEQTFQLQLAFKQLKKMGYESAYINYRADVADSVAIHGKYQGDMSVLIQYDENNDKPWRVVWFNYGGGRQQDCRFVDFADVLDEIEPLPR